jgi:hypothetical protein
VWSDQTYGEIAISFPGEPKTTQRTQDMVGFTANITEHVLKRGDSSYAVTIVDVPEAKQWDAVGSVDGSITEMLKHLRSNPGLKEISVTLDRKEKVGKMPARRVSATISMVDGSTGVVQALSCSRFTRTYTTLAVTTTKLESEYAEKMLSSVKPVVATRSKK